MLTADRFVPQPNLVDFGVGGQVHDVILADMNGDEQPEILVAAALNTA